MKAIYTILFSVFILRTATSNTVQSNSKIKEVTLFLSSAQVFREAKVNLVKGENKIEFIGLSPNIIENTFQIKFDNQVEVLSLSKGVSEKSDFDKNPDIAFCKNKIKIFNEEWKLKSASKKVLEKEEAILDKNQILTESNTILSSDQLKSHLDLQQSRWMILFQKKNDLDNDILTLNDSINLYEEKIKKKAIEFANKSNVFTVLVKSTQTKEYDCEFSYLVSNAGWYLTYNARAVNVASPINLSHVANVFQNTGEEWKSIKLKLSNGIPNENKSLPSLNPLFLKDRNFRLKAESSTFYNKNIKNVTGKVTDENGEGLISATVMVEGTSVGTVTDFDGNYSLSIPEGGQKLIVSYVGHVSLSKPINSSTINFKLESSAKMMEQVVIVKGSKYKVPLIESESTKMRLADDNDISIRGARGESTEYFVDGVKVSNKPQTEVNFEINNYEFELPNLATVLSNGKVNSFTLKTDKLQTFYQYFTVPKLDKSVYLKAYVSNWKDLNLIDGEISLYYEGTFLGKTLFQSTALDTFELSLGIDKSIQTDRKKVKEKTKSQLIGDKKTESLQFEITALHSKPFPINLMVVDQVPVSNAKEIEVEVKDEASLDLDSETGEVKWKLILQPNEKRKLDLSYTVKYPKNYMMIID